VRAQLGIGSWTDKLAPGAIGEHLTLAGVLESDVCVGDLLRFPDCTLAISEPRLPGAELNAVLGFAQAEKAMAAQGWCGFHLAVRIPGTIAAGKLSASFPARGRSASPSCSARAWPD
jgi:MOSC domain-containing protein YiiM